MALVSLIAFLIILILATTTKLNLGLMAIVASSLVGGAWGHLSTVKILEAFPTDLFLTLFGVTYLFSHAQKNGSLDKLSSSMISFLGGTASIAPLGFFALTLFLSGIGAGNIAGTALIAPPAMAVAHKLKISPFLMAIFVANGANAGALSPLAPTGIIAAERMAQVGLTGLQWRTFLNSFFAHSVIVLIAFFLFGGRRLLFRKHAHPESSEVDSASNAPFETKHWLTLVVIGIVLLSATAFHLDLGFCSIAGGLFLGLFRLSEEKSAITHVPWGTILMVCGMSMFVSVIEALGGIGLLTDWLSKASTPNTILMTTAFSAGLVSVYSSSSAVVLPTFLLMIPNLTAQFPDVSAVSLASTINVSAHLVDVSPLSTVGALCIAAAQLEDRAKLFNKMLFFGLSMAGIGALICYVLFGLIL